MGCPGCVGFVWARDEEGPLGEGDWPDEEEEEEVVEVVVEGW